jgi:hypothetical protein
MFKEKKKKYQITIVDIDPDREKIYFKHDGQILIFDSFINLKKYILENG